MQKIQILDSHIYNRIAAGEVVEAPFCVVKELIENSIDAGATSIIVEIKNGGIDYICVSDNGHGIEKDQVKLAFSRHATSKIKCLEDLDTIASLGFRGEALSSIASVASVKMVSRIAADELGYTVHFDTGILKDEGEIGAGLGTTIKVENLFINVPARRKFLKSASSEKAEITKLVSKLILANPNISIKYIADEKTVFYSIGEGAEAALATIYGTEAEFFFPIQKSAPGIEISGFVSRPENSKSNRNHQTVIVNGRFVECNDISYTVLATLKDYLMQRRHPAYVIYIKIPFDMLDINVHPQKTEVKFIDQKRITSLIYQVITQNIKAMFSNVGDMFDSSKLQHNEVEHLKISDFRLDSSGDSGDYASSENDSIKVFDNNISYSSLVMCESPTRLSFSNKSITSIAAGDLGCSSTNKTLDSFTNYSAIQVYDQDGIKLDCDLSIFRQLGTIFNTYILIEKDDVLYMIDQHAAHERLLYNKFKAVIENQKPNSQPLLIPFEISNRDCFDDQAISPTIVDTLNQIGFDIRKNKIFAVPLCLYNIELELFVQELDNNDRVNQITTLDFIKEKIIRSACKAAVKSGDTLSSGEIDSLLKELSREKELCCPHGRPLIIKMTRREVDKLFKRIL